jgi:putative transposase
MLEFLFSVLAALRVFVCSRSDTALEVLALRQQVAVLKRQRPRPTLTRLDRFFWTTLRHLWPRWAHVLLIVKPETVVRWHRAGFRLYWRWRSRQRGGRPRISEEMRTLIRRLAAENGDWGAPRIHGELLKLGFDVSERSVARYLRRVPRRGDPATRWSAFLANHREAIYVDYYHHDRIHDALEKDTPDHRSVEPKPSAHATVMSTARAGGLHHRYSWRDAA